MTATVPAREVLVTLLNELMLADFQPISRVDEVDVAPASEHPFVSEPASATEQKEESAAESIQSSVIASSGSPFSESADAESVECDSMAVNSSGETLSFVAGTVIQEVAPAVSASTDPQKQSWRATLDQLTDAASVTVTSPVIIPVAESENLYNQPWQAALQQLAATTTEQVIQ